jgi:hypothetical protein
MLELVIASITCGIAWLVVHGWSSLHRNRVEHLRFHICKFFETAEILTQDDTTSDWMLDQIKKIAERMRNPQAVHILLSATTQLDREIRNGTPTPPLNLNAPAAWYALLWESYMAISYMTMIRGILIRSMLANILNPRITGMNTSVIDQKVHSLSPQVA